MDGIGAGEEATLAVFEPLGEDLVAADLVGPEVGGDAIEVLGGVDADAPTVGVVFDLFDSADTRCALRRVVQRGLSALR
jgi:hypothetical protein